MKAGMIFLIGLSAALGALPTRLRALPVPAEVSPAPAPEPQAAAPQVGTLKGNVKIKGEIPRRTKISTSADPKCAAMHKDALFTDDVVTDAAGNVQWAFVYIKAGLGEQKFSPPKAPVIIEQKGCRFNPHVFGIMIGQEMKVRNGDALMHIIHVVPANNREFGFSQERQGEERIKTFTGKEVMIRVFCDVHPWMTAWAGVLDHPFHATTLPNGTWTIKDVPAGKYTIEVWQEKYAPVTQEVEVKAKETKTLNFELTQKK